MLFSFSPPQLSDQPLCFKILYICTFASLKNYANKEQQHPESTMGKEETLKNNYVNSSKEWQLFKESK